jgi:hemolysin D
MSARTTSDPSASPAEESQGAANPKVPPRHATRELLGRYRAVFRAAWAHRTELAGPKRLGDEAAFLPAALSLQETPVHPAPRRLAFGLMALFVLAVLWAIFGQVDIVAVAPGRIIVSERTKVIQPLEASVVKRVLVKDGDWVKAGQVLVELDPTTASADKSSVQQQLAAAWSEERRTTALLQALGTGSAPVLSALLTLPALPASPVSAARPDLSALAKPTQDSQEAQALQSLQSLLQAEYQDIRAKLARLDAEAQRRQAELRTVEATITKLEATLPMAQTREADFKRLVDQGYISGHATQDRTRERVEMEQDLAMQRARLAEAQSALQEAAKTKVALQAETQRTLSERQAQARTQRQQLQAELSKAKQRERLTQLTAPVDGVIQQLAIHSIGGVVTSAQPLMVVVPDATELTAEVRVANQDIGFVNTSQIASVKLETFPYTKYGTVDAQVKLVTADAVTDEKTGQSHYPTLLTLSRKSMVIDGKTVPISPGMNITAEIKTGQRRVIEFLLSPVQRARSESFRER